MEARERHTTARPRQRTPILGQGGFTIIETLVVLGMIAAMAAVAVSIFNPAQYNHRSAIDGIVANLRLTRAAAVSRGTHYRVVNSGTDTYEIRRLEWSDVEDDWVVVPGATRVVSLPPSIRIQGSLNVEFTTRGTLVDGSPVVSIPIHDQVNGTTVPVSVWPSGQIGEG